MASTSVEIAQIQESLLVTHTAYCEKCAKESESVMNEPNTFSQFLYKNGWRMLETGGDPLLICPACAEKYITK